MRIKLPFKIKKTVLALGPQTKNTVCFVKNHSAWISRVHPDLDSPEDHAIFEKDVRESLKKGPQTICCDLHPGYQSTKYAYKLRATGCKLRYVQHHHAHIASCMAENGLKNQKVIGVAFDGAGLGANNRIWGGEFLICDYKSYTRAGSLKDIPLLGMDKAVLEPARVAAAWLFTVYKDSFLKLGIGFIKNFNRKHWPVLKKMYLSGFNSIPTSSMGRLFDAAACIVLAKQKTDFEAALPMELERSAGRFFGRSTHYPFRIDRIGSQFIIDPGPMFKNIVEDLKSREKEEKIAYRVHLTAAEMVCKMCILLRKKFHLNKVVLSGGVFQNKLLLRIGSDLLYKRGFSVFVHKKLPANDASVSLGQALIASQRG